MSAGFQPKWVVVDSDSDVDSGDGSPGSIHRSDSLSGDISLNFSWDFGPTTFDNCIQSLTATGFELGSDTVVNGGGVDYYWIAFAGEVSPATSKPKIIMWAEVDPN